MVRRIHDRTYYPNERRVNPPSHRRRVLPPSHNNSRSPPPSNRRRLPSPSYGYGHSSTPSKRRPKASPSYYCGRSTKHSYGRPLPRGITKKIIIMSAIFLVVISLSAYGFFTFLNPGSTNNYNDTTPPITQILSPASGSTVSGTVLISISASDNRGVSKVEMYIDNSLVATDTSTPYDYSWDTTTYNDGSHEIKVITFDTAGNTDVELRAVNVDNNGGGNFDEKIATFFWASDENLFLGQQIIDRYIDILEDEGYTKFFQFKDTNNFEADFQQVANYEDSNDIVFFYLIGHGYNDGQHSYTYFKEGTSRVASNEFRDMCDTLDSSRVGLLIESCKSGDWSDDMIGGGYLAISTSDETHNAYGEYPLPSEGLFTGAFFDAVQSGSNAIGAFWAGRSVASSQYPKLCDESVHDFFAG